jgi:low affinity Fe/Cu permease
MKSQSVRIRCCWSVELAVSRRNVFTHFSSGVAHLAGQPVTFGLACFCVLAWGVSGPLFGFSQTWQLVINTTTTIITFLMVFVLQNTQNRESEALHAKLDELILVGKAENTFIGVERLSEAEIKKLHALVEQAAKAGAQQPSPTLEEPQGER